jgi:hypothetical protein
VSPDTVQLVIVLVVDEGQAFVVVMDAVVSVAVIV